MRLAVTLLAVLALAAPAAQAKKWFGGVVPDVPTAQPTPRALRAHAATYLPYGGGPVLHSNRTHVIFWQPSGSTLSYDPGYMSLVDTFMSNVATDSHRPTNPYGLSGQYRDAGGPAAYSSSFVGSVLSTDPLPPGPPACTEPLPPPLGTGPGWTTCLDDQQLEDEIAQVVNSRHLPQSQRDVYLLVLPNGFGTCEYAGYDQGGCALGGEGDPGSFCGYHSETADGLLYAVIPYNAVAGHCQSVNPRPNSSTADPAISTISHEHSEMVTDPFADAWITNDFEEDGDLCLQQFGPALGGTGQLVYNQVIAGHHYYLQDEWSNADGSCQPRAKADRVSFVPPAHPRAGAAVPFSARGSAPQARIARYDWWFGDGKAGHGRNSSHAYRRAGRYRVVVRTTDSWANWSFSARTITVARPAAHGRRHKRG